MPSFYVPSAVTEPCPLSFRLPLSVSLNLWNLIYSNLTPVIISSLCCSHTQWYATIHNCWRDPVDCVPSIFSTTDSMVLIFNTCTLWQLPEEVSAWVPLLSLDFFPWKFGCDISRIVHVYKFRSNICILSPDCFLLLNVPKPPNLSTSSKMPQESENRGVLLSQLIQQAASCKLLNWSHVIFRRNLSNFK